MAQLNVTSHPVKCNKQTKNMWHICSCGGLLKSLKQLQENIPHSRAEDLEHNIPSDCWSEYSGVKKGGNRQEEGNIRRKTEKEEVKFYGKSLEGKGKEGR